MTRTSVIGVAGLVAIAACGDNGVERPGPPPPAKLVVRVEPASVADCPFGGSVVSSGIDENRNGVLDDEEVAKRTPLCNDPPAAAPLKTMVRLVPELRGEHCALDGTAVQSGPDRNGNGVLDDDEVEETRIECGSELSSDVAR